MPRGSIRKKCVCIECNSDGAPISTVPSNLMQAFIHTCADGKRGEVLKIPELELCTCSCQIVGVGVFHSHTTAPR